MKKKIFIQFFSVTFVAVLLVFLFGVVAVHLNAEEIVKERLKEETRLVCSLIEKTDDFNRLEKYEHDDAFRITVVNLDGDVLFESDTKAPLENHAEREEIKKALNGTPTAIERYSETIGSVMTYYAMKTELLDGGEVVLRLAVKNSEISSYLGVALPILFVVLIVALVASLIISNLLSDKLARKITEVGDSLKSLNNGDYQPIKTNSSETELYSVLNEINELNESAHKHLREISQEHAKLNTVLENVSQGIIAIDRNRKIVFANKSVLNIFGAEDSLAGKDFIYLIDDMPLYEKIARHFGENYQSDYFYHGKELSVVIRKAENEKDGVFSIVIITDVTAEKAIQKQKSEFFANASHELKTPVTVMQGLSELLMAKETLDTGSKKQVERIHKESVRLSLLISDMLKLSRLERGEESEMVLSDVGLRDVAEEVLAELSPKLTEKNITATVTGDAHILADNKKIFELIENLCSNGVNYNKENGTLNVMISETKEGVCLKVSDTGIGIAKEHIPRLCERFYRVDKSRSKKTGGTGLGLAIVKHICALYHATLSIESEVEVGTTITIVFLT